ncbi:DUF1822 family protein [Anabaena sp. FACHB-1237]|uniref:DUF1822 family protein n=1 Tax=Anabaena sp. FACHB-1237 TaxID=2692769 RepID=UPI0016815EF1|nr:DUF1822 family protein [Anabaena sp. FACHB-1237]MBD2139360.1 DUF1822 family protein [Anabaena sp. FACHB-1237]
MNISFNQINNQEEVVMLNIEELKNFYLEHLWIKISEQDKKEAEGNTRYYANPTRRNYAYFNYLCHKLFRKWLKEYQEIESNNQLFPSENDLARIWQFINGSVVNICGKRLILIPSDATDLEGFEVQKEWVDVPNLAGDYYLPVRVDLETNYLHIWGFISRKNLQRRADYDEFEKLYIVDANDVIDDLETLWIALELSEEKGSVQHLSSLKESEAQALIQEYKKYMKTSPYSPRLYSPGLKCGLKWDFEQWCALLNNQQWLQQLTQEDNIMIDLGKWLNSQFDQAIELGWKLTSDLIRKPPQLVTLSTNVIKSFKRAKLVNFYIGSQQESVILVLEIEVQNNNKYQVLIQVHPSNGNPYLPINLSLTAIDLQSGESLQKITSGRDNLFIQLSPLLCDRGDKFRVELSLEGQSMSDNFCI